MLEVTNLSSHGFNHPPGPDDYFQLVYGSNRCTSFGPVSPARLGCKSLNVKAKSGRCASVGLPFACASPSSSLPVNKLETPGCSYKFLAWITNYHWRVYGIVISKTSSKRLTVKIGIIQAVLSLYTYFLPKLLTLLVQVLENEDHLLLRQAPNAWTNFSCCKPFQDASAVTKSSSGCSPRPSLQTPPPPR